MRKGLQPNWIERWTVGEKSMLANKGEIALRQP